MIGVEVSIPNIWVWISTIYIPSSYTRAKVSFNRKDIIYDDGVSVRVEKGVLLELV